MNSTRFKNGPVQVYLREIGKIPPLSEDLEIELSRHVRANDEQAESAGRTLIEANLGMVVSIAKGYARGNMQLLDLVQGGNRGLMSALETFADSPGLSFSAYAAACVKAAVEKAIAEATGAQ